MRPRVQSCAVATACFGDVNAPEVERLRVLRDTVLARSTLGRLFILMYYNGLSEIGVALLSLTPFLKRPTRWFLKNISSKDLTARRVRALMFLGGLVLIGWFWLMTPLLYDPQVVLGAIVFYIIFVGLLLVLDP